MRLIILPLILICISFFPNLVLGQAFVDYDPGIFNSEVQVKRIGSEIQMTGKSCDVLNSEAQAIKTWSKKVMPKSKEPGCKCSEGQCSLNISQIVPDLVNETQGVCPANAGPNCLNTTLVSSGLVANLRYTTAKEMSFWLASPLCKERKPGEPKKPGDIVVFKEDGEEIHAFVHVSKNLAFSRNGSRRFPYTFQSPETGYEVYRVKKGCEDTYKTPEADKGCKVWTNTYSCIGFEEYVKTKPIKNEEQKETLKLLDKNECFLSAQAFSKTLNTEMLELTKAALLSIQKLADKRFNSSVTEEDKLIWKSISLKADANYSQYLLLSY